MDVMGKVRRLKLHDKRSTSAIARATGLSRNTVKKRLKAPGDIAPKYVREAPEGKPSPYKDVLGQALKRRIYTVQRGAAQRQGPVGGGTDGWWPVPVFRPKARTRRPGIGAAGFMLGMRHGAFCVGCCGLPMALLFVGGIMNLIWIAAPTLFVLVEKLMPAGAAFGRVSGALMILWAGAALLPSCLKPRDTFEEAGAIHGGYMMGRCGCNFHASGPARTLG